jgi:hypothetical protein
VGELTNCAEPLNQRVPSIHLSQSHKQKQTERSMEVGTGPLWGFVVAMHETKGIMSWKSVYAWISFCVLGVGKITTNVRIHA